jgi:hypothetical protein
MPLKCVVSAKRPYQFLFRKRLCPTSEVSQVRFFTRLSSHVRILSSDRGIRDTMAPPTSRRKNRSATARQPYHFHPSS